MSGSRSSKVVLVSGANRGLGLGLVRELIRRGGCSVVATCRSPSASGASELRALLEASGQNLPLACDVSDDRSVAECLAKVANTHDRLDLLINNAGIATSDHPNDPPKAIKRDELLKVMDVNVGGVLSLTQAFLPMLRKSGGGGVVVNIGSAMGSVEMTKTSEAFTATSYRCSKAALNMLTMAFANEVKDVVFASIHPGWVQTDMGSTKNRKPPVTPEQSAEGILNTVEKLTKSESGTFWSFEGKKLPY